jgi:hypothetical protein
MPSLLLSAGSPAHHLLPFRVPSVTHRRNEISANSTIRASAVLTLAHALLRKGEIIPRASWHEKSRGYIRAKQPCC